MTLLERLFNETTERRFDFVDAVEDDDDAFRDAVLAGLSASPKSIAPRFLYDSRGSALFDRICELPEYYLTRAETAILEEHAEDIAATIGPDAYLIELGSGSSRKTRLLLDALAQPAGYAPIDVAREQLRLAASAIACEYPGLKVAAIAADYAGEFDLPDFGDRRVAFFPGSTIGNLNREAAVALLRKWRRRVGRSGMMVIGADLKKDAAILEAAYDDVAGVTERFIKNILLRANRELGADFTPAMFEYDARYVHEEGRVEMHLVSRVDQYVRVADRSFSLAAGERIHIENSHKYSWKNLAALARASGFVPADRYTDDQRRFSVQVWAADERTLN